MREYQDVVFFAFIRNSYRYFQRHIYINLIFYFLHYNIYNQLIYIFIDKKEKSIFFIFLIRCASKNEIFDTNTHFIIITTIITIIIL